jgi:hypothetical protein
LPEGISSGAPGSKWRSAARLRKVPRLDWAGRNAAEIMPLTFRSA